jgi:hypothetical protein
MYKSILVILLAGLLAAPALAVPPPGGWGQCEELHEWGGYYEDFGLFNHDGWHLQFPMPENPEDRRFFCAFGSIELWIELYASMTCYNVHWQFHRISDDQFFAYFYVYGFVSSNSLINVEVDGGDLVFIDDKFGPDGGDSGGRISVDYAYAAGDLRNGDPPMPQTQAEIGMYYQRFQPVEQVPFCIEVGPCDWWWAFIGELCVPYHKQDGYYLLEMVVCPIPWL